MQRVGPAAQYLSYFFRREHVGQPVRTQEVDIPRLGAVLMHLHIDSGTDANRAREQIAVLGVTRPFRLDQASVDLLL